MNCIRHSRFITLLSMVMIFLAVTGCDEEDESPIVYETSTMMDIESNVYTTIKIGNQWWMTENLRVTTFRNGQPIPNGQLSQDWTDSSAAYCMFQNDPVAPGLLYNWYAVQSASGLAPAGWHIATDEDWKELEKTLGMSAADADKSGWRGTTEGNKLKLAGTTGWSAYQDNWPTNESGFSADAGGCRLPTSVWGDPALFSTGFWWTASSKDNDRAYYRYLDYKTSTVYRSADSKLYGFSVRCVKD
jgi:uncharacterized protein (TIGR02145 family)